MNVPAPGLLRRGRNLMVSAWELLSKWTVKSRLDLVSMAVPLALPVGYAGALAEEWGARWPCLWKM